MTPTALCCILVAMSSVFGTPEPACSAGLNEARCVDPLTWAPPAVEVSASPSTAQAKGLFSVSLECPAGTHPVSHGQLTWSWPSAVVAVGCVPTSDGLECWWRALADGAVTPNVSAWAVCR